MKKNLFNLSRRQWSNILDDAELLAMMGLYATALFGSLILAWFGWCL